MIPHNGRSGSTLLTERQLQIGRLLQRGASVKAIARKLGISVRTVDQHIRQAVKRIGTTGRPIVVLAVWMERYYGRPAGSGKTQAPAYTAWPATNRLDHVAMGDDCPLTDRQLAVTRLVHAGFRYGEIAQQLHCADSTVKAHVRDATQRIGGRGDSKVVLTRYYERTVVAASTPDVRLVS